jgi:hypothetical protein
MSIDLRGYRQTIRLIAADIRGGSRDSTALMRYAAALRVMLRAGWDGQLEDDEKLPPEVMPDMDELRKEVGTNPNPSHSL